MKTFFVLILFSFASIYSQNKDDYFVLHKNGKKQLKPVKYILFTPNKDGIKRRDGIISFTIGGENFIFNKTKHKIDICKNINLDKIDFKDSETLSQEEYKFHNRMVKNDSYWKNKGIKLPMPIVKLHPYFKVIVVEIIKDKVIKYETDWTYLNDRGFKN